MLGYWKNATATIEKFAGEYLATSYLGEMDANGYIKYLCRNDDVITRAGYPVRPAPIEECPVRHPSMRFAAVIGVKDDIRTEILKPYIGQEGAIVQHQRKTAMAFPVSNQLHSVLIERASK